MRGEVLSVGGPHGDGLISGDDGLRYRFVSSAARQVVRVGDRVDFVAVEGAATDIFPLRPEAGAYAHGPAAGRSDLSVWGHFKRSVTEKYVDGAGRGTRKEYWSFTLFYWLFLIVPMFLGFFLDAVLGLGTSEDPGPFGMIGSVIAVLVFLGLWLPGLCALIRRFHDVGLSGWLILIGLIPYAGGLFTFVVSLLDSQSGPNKHGPVPGRAPRSTAEVFS